jgi:hypothetical protein
MMKAPRPYSLVTWAFIGAVIGIVVTLMADREQGGPSLIIILASAAIGGVWGTSLSQSEDD